MLTADRLWPTIEEATARAIAAGALESIATECLTIEAEALDFQIRLLSRQLARKRIDKTQRPADFNPFLPCDPDLLVGDLTPTHRAVLNKFNVIDHHLLIVTREMVDQEEFLDLADFEALDIALEAIDGLGFYNSGVVAGASQRHKHLQLVPPLGPSGSRAPVDESFRLLLANAEGAEITQVPYFRFPHGLLPLPTPTHYSRADFMHSAYRLLINLLGCEQSPLPYNLLCTRDWLFLAPRRREHFATISVNALGFAGSLLVRDQKELALIEEAGPLAVLHHVGGGEQVSAELLDEGPDPGP